MWHENITITYHLNINCHWWPIKVYHLSIEYATPHFRSTIGLVKYRVSVRNSSYTQTSRTLESNHFNRQIVLKLCTEHDSDTVVLCAKFPKRFMMAMVAANTHTIKAKQTQKKNYFRKMPLRNYNQDETQRVWFFYYKMSIGMWWLISPLKIHDVHA